MEDDKMQLVRDAEILLRKFDNPEELLQENPVFAKCYMSLIHGESPYKLIEQLCNMISSQQETLKDIITNKNTPSFKIELTSDNLELIFKESFLSDSDYPDWG